MVEETTAVQEAAEAGPVLRCKMRVDGVSQNIGSDGKPTEEYVTLRAVSGVDGTANAQWSKYTPSAQLMMTITNTAAFGKLLPGQEFYMDFVPAAE